MYSVRNTKCTCQPETCCCPAYEIIKTNENEYFVVARGNNFLDLEAIVAYANSAIQGEEK